MVVERLNAWQWAALGLGTAIVLGMVLYPPWRCYTSTGYRVPGSTLKQLSKGPLQTDFPPNEPMLYDIHRSAVVYSWLFHPPTRFAGMRWNAEIEWGRLGTRCGIVLLATVAGVVLLRDSGVLRRLLTSRRG
ncbi:MAG TPA: hypothetical protein VNE39_23180 [Planctomycetota bacterium]|nr:hypothetical protein [Planctomycetota bacterium]